jgi:hypothetical protein
MMDRCEVLEGETCEKENYKKGQKRRKYMVQYIPKTNRKGEGIWSNIKCGSGHFSFTTFNSIRCSK